MGKLKWLDTYYKELADKPGMGEIEWRDEFKKYVLLKGLRYPSKLVRTEQNRTDIRINTPQGISHIVFETKKADADLDKGATFTQAKGYLQGGESFLVLASPHRLRVFTPKGTHIANISLTEKDIQDNATFWQLSYEYMAEKRHLATFREGKLDYCYIPVDTPDGFEKFIFALRLCGDLLLRHLRKAWQEHNTRYQEYKEKLAEFNSGLEALEASLIPGEEKKEREERIAQKKARLRAQYSVSIEVMESSFPAFRSIQPYSRDVEEKKLIDIYLADITYATLNRMLFVRIAEDKQLLTRKISNGGVGFWRSFVTYLKDNYQDLLQIAYQDSKEIYEHFFEEGIFDWYIKGNSDLNEVLETILFVLNSYDLSKVNQDILGDLYQEYLPAQKRKELGEFYTPREIIDYILRHIGWTGRGTIIDPACGSGGFLIRAAHSLLQDMEHRGISEEARLRALPSIIGLDINPFATHIAEMNFIFLILDIYLKAREEAKRADRKFTLERLPIYQIDSLVGVTGGTTLSFAHSAHLEEVEDAIEARDRLTEYDYLVMNPPYVRNERLPVEPRARYRETFKDVASGNADIFTYFMKKAVDWLRDETGKLGVIVSLGLADARANARLRKFLSVYTIERIVPLEWTEVFVSNVNPMLLFLKKKHPDKEHKIALVHGIRSLKDLDQDKGYITYIPQERWLQLAPDKSWRIEIQEHDLPILEKLKAIPGCLTGEYGLALRTIAGGRELISDNPSQLENPYPLLDGREVKAWSIEWQGRYIDYQPKLISDPKTIDFFKSPKVISRLISLTSQAAVDESGDKLARNTVMVIRSQVKELNDHPYVIAALVNSLTIRYYAFLMLRAGVVQQGYSHFYSGVISNMPIPRTTFSDKGIRGRLDILSESAHRIAKEMVEGDRDALKVIDSMIGQNTIPFSQLSKSDLSGYLVEIDVASAQVSEVGELTSKKMSVVRGDPIILQYMLNRAALQGVNELSKADIENYPVPKDMNICLNALERMDIWAQRKPTLTSQLGDIQSEIDELVLSAFYSLSDAERQHIKKRVNEFPLDQVLVTDKPGAPTKIIPVKYWETGARYRG